ncbi:MULTISPECIES: aminodeoxychorismate lyase [Vibrio]|uniref:aminodeoxychorismate lyase n=1 Tax=Vibrio TaxID=662 RepID=UPI00207638D3|nr:MULTISPECIES: aminodeoxychorismate lyase [Vibrio]USD33394.1 aminodeoxychorismate lyase [Vibrio sp. SCSIO 43186]USD46463.1 aminodeoxychorismate lyase [Vibrio sp. SCSIO 43145]USD70518.1 aminodeoxychorismate lyase [Vibrio sp. SCSIO 43139]USD95437.1 aminodeoxychorismate lyase [Vibrio coralliilyticus]
MYWVNGQAAEMIALADRSFQYGDGCFTTMLVVDGDIEHWGKHKERMQSCLEVLDIQPPDWQDVETWLRSARINAPKSGLKLHISRGVGGRGYSPTQVTLPNVTISAFHYPVHYEKWLTDGICLGVCQKRLGLNPLLAGHKHNNRLEQILLKAEMDNAGWADGIALDVNDRVIETTMANVFWVKQGIIHTPDLTNAGVSGVMRRVVIETLLRDGVQAQSGDYTLDQLCSADEVFVCNSILGVAPVKSVGTQAYSIGTITKKIQEMVNP